MSGARRRPGPDRLHGLMWVAFANAAALLALVVPAHILLQGVLGPLGLPAFDQRYDTFVRALDDPLVRIYLIVLAAGAFYILAWRAAYVIHELGVHAKGLVWLACFGLAGAGTAAAAYVVLTAP